MYYTLSLLTVVAVLHLATVAHGYSSGPPDSACNDMVPRHGVQPQSSASPYVVSSVNKTAKPGDIVEVRLGSNNRANQFKGFFIRAVQDFKLVGGIFRQGSMGTRCNGAGLVHSSPAPKSEIQTQYKVPDDIKEGELVFIATVVERREKFWTKILADPIRIVANTGSNTATDSSTVSTTSNNNNNNNNNNSNNNNQESNSNNNNANNENVSVTMGTGQDNNGVNGANQWKNEKEPGSKPSGTISLHSDCGKTRGCFHDCVNGMACTFVVYWKPMNDSVLFRIVYKMPTPSDKWIALALSHDVDMGDDTVMECVMDGVQVLVKTSYNNGKYNDYPDDKQAALSHYKGFVENGVLGCQFIRKISYPREPKVFDLHSSYYLFIATGEAVAGNKFPHSYEHLPVVSREKISVLRVKEVEKGHGVLYPMVKIHGTAMILAWVLFANIGVFVSRHGRNMFNSTTPCGTDVWFHIHRFCMTMTLFLTLVGFLLILIESHGRSHIPQVPGKSYVILHPPLGLIVIILTIVNPLMALYRPALSSPSRPLFRWTHWGFGVFSWFVSFIVVAIGLNLQKAQAEKESVYIMCAFMGYTFLMEILIRVVPFTCGALGYCCKKMWCGHRDSYDFNIELRPSEIASVTSSNGSNKDLANADLERITRTENTVVSVMVLLHIAACTGFTSGVLYFALRRSFSIVIANH